MQKTPPITRGRKFAQVLDGARKIFLRDGFEGASVDDIAREAGVSKATLYSYFPDKRLMFIEVFRAELSRETHDSKALINIDLPVHQVLPFVVQMLTGHLVSEFGIRVWRLSASEAERFPALAAEYYNSGPRDVQFKLSEYFEYCISRGELEIDDLALAADQLLQLCAVRVFDKAMFLGPASVTDEEIKQCCAGTVRMFLLTYGSKAVRDQVRSQEARPVRHSTAAE
ncbi:TetR/AcrR family transcriptional regulator [Paracoccus sp. (in: a-proteobacteria)]|uniref:TetR/AcrR family transcriptional regulator n=1 Tax=Paracoccus sp. TaxID=267 RepID=UPI0034CED865